ncbi:MAG: sulfotransferase domain-containing protein, partial [Trichodesmium sp. ALOHA_ZT_67]|nr:sulfotransferase domain-containing protein [Trichodesmium sp. ALOHA_ZT_67]
KLILMSENKLQPTDKVLINSLPKSGTHLLAQAIEIFGYQEHFIGKVDLEDEWQLETPRFLAYQWVKKVLNKEQTNYQTEDSQGKIGIGAAVTDFYVETSALKHWLNLIQPGKYILGHIPHTPLLNPLLADLNSHHCLIIRDPRDVFVSNFNFILDTRKMGCKSLLRDDFVDKSETERFNFLLQGGYAKERRVQIRSFAERYRGMLAWRDEPGCLLLRFEDLVGEAGGGSYEKQLETVKKIALHLGVSFDNHISSKLEEIYNPNSRTFRTGKIGGWKNSLDQGHLERLIEYCQPLCEEGGYS